MDEALISKFPKELDCDGNLGALDPTGSRSLMKVMHRSNPWWEPPLQYHGFHEKSGEDGHH